MLQARVPHDHLHVMDELLDGERRIELEQLMLRMGHRDERHLEQRLSEESRRDASRHDDIGGAIGNRIFRAGQHGVGELHLGVRAELLQLRHDLEQPIAWKRGVDHQPQLRFPSLLETARESLERIRVPEQRTSAPQQRLAMWSQHGLASFDHEHRHVELFLQARDRIADRRLALVERRRRLRESAVIDHRGQHRPLLERGAGNAHAGMNEMVRISMLSRAGASGGALGSSNAVWPVHCTRELSESNSLKASTSSGCMRGA